MTKMARGVMWLLDFHKTSVYLSTIIFYKTKFPKQCDQNRGVAWAGTGAARVAHASPQQL